MSAPEPNASPSGGGGSSLTVENIVLLGIAGIVIRLRDAVLAAILGAQEWFFSALSSGGESLSDSLGAVGAVPLELFALLEETLVELASIAGPFAPIVTIGIWAFVALATLALIRGILWALPLVIPWL